MGKAGLPLWALSAALGLGIFLSFKIPIPLQGIFIAVTLSSFGLGICWLCSRRVSPYGFLAMSLLTFLSYGSLLGSLELPKNTAAHLVHLFPEPDKTGYLKMPQDDSLLTETRFLLSLETRRRPTAFSRQWIARVRAINGSPASGRLLLQFPSSVKDSLWVHGDRIYIYGIPITFDPPRNPGGFQFKNYMQTQGVWHQIKVSDGQFRHRKAVSSPLYRISQWRQKLHWQLLNSGLSRESASVYSALILGERGEVENELRSAYQKAGTAHLLAISGLHVGLVLVLIRLLLRYTLGRFRFRGRRLLLFWLSFLALWGYSALAGFGPSVVRASCMLSLWLLAELMYRKGQSLHFLGLAAMLMLAVINPLWMLQPGFQLSFGAVWGILAFFPFLKRHSSRLIDHFTQKRSALLIKKTLGKVADLTGVSLSAQLGVFPIALFHFHQFPWHFLAGSLVLVPFLGILLSLGFALLLASFYGLIPKGLIWLAETLLQLQNSLVRQLAKQEEFLSSNIRWDFGHMFLAYLVLICLALATKQCHAKSFQLRKRYTFFRLAIIAGSLLVVYDLQEEISASKVREVWVPHRTASSGLWFRKGNSVLPFAENPSDWNSVLENYAEKDGLEVKPIQEIKTAYRIGNSLLLRISGSAQSEFRELKQIPPVKDSALGYSFPLDGKPLILLLSHSPKPIDSTLLSRLEPTLIIADGSNYYSALDRWEGLCQKLKIPFHATARKGAFRIDLKTSVSNKPVND